MLDIFNQIDIDIFSFIICALLLFDTYNRNEKHLFEYRLFNTLLISNMILLLLDAATWAIDGQTFINPTIYITINVLGYMMNPVPPFLWLLYADYQVFNDEKHTRKIFWPFLVPAIINAIMALLTPLTGLLFYLDQNNIYHRGPWFPLLVGIVYSYLIYTFILILRNRNIIEKRSFASLLCFSIPPVICGILQTFNYGVVLLWSSVTLSLLIVYLNIQNRKLHTDYLTGICNRMQFDRYLQARIRNGTEQNTFGGILLDIDNFKTINDDYGHNVGDEALEVIAELLKTSLRKDDFLARYGGDEFIAILDVQKNSDLKKSVERIYEKIKDYNIHANKPYQLSLSMGYDIYDYNSGMNKDQFIKHIDTLMYECKRGGTR